MENSMETENSMPSTPFAMPKSRSKCSPPLHLTPNNAVPVYSSPTTATANEVEIDIDEENVVFTHPKRRSTLLSQEGITSSRERQEEDDEQDATFTALRGPSIPSAPPLNEDIEIDIDEENVVFTHPKRRSTLLSQEGIVQGSLERREPSRSGSRSLSEGAARKSVDFDYPSGSAAERSASRRRGRSPAWREGASQQERGSSTHSSPERLRPLSSGRSSYVNEEREVAEQTRKFMLVQALLMAQEEGARFVAMLEQLLRFREISRQEFEERLQYLPKEEAEALRKREAQRQRSREVDIWNVQHLMAKASAALQEEERRKARDRERREREDERERERQQRELEKEQMREMEKKKREEARERNRKREKEKDDRSRRRRDQERRRREEEAEERASRLEQSSIRTAASTPPAVLLPIRHTDLSSYTAAGTSTSRVDSPPPYIRKASRDLGTSPYTPPRGLPKEEEQEEEDGNTNPNPSAFSPVPNVNDRTGEVHTPPQSTLRGTSDPYGLGDPIWMEIFGLQEAINHVDLRIQRLGSTDILTALRRLRERVNALDERTEAVERLRGGEQIIKYLEQSAAAPPSSSSASPPPRTEALRSRPTNPEPPVQERSRTKKESPSTTSPAYVM